MLILPDAGSQSRQLLDDAIADRFRITMLVMGDNQGEDAIASKADIRAQAMASTRRVVWIRDTNLLTPAERTQFMKDSNTAVCVLNLDDTAVEWLPRLPSPGFMQLERAFLKGQGAA